MASAKDKAEKKEKRSYTVTDAVLRACRKNAKASTGPRGEGKKRVGQNSRTHALTCQGLIEGEDPEDLRSIENLLGASVAAEAPVEIYFCKQAALASVRFQRTVNADAWAVRDQIAKARKSQQDRRRREVDGLMAQLAESPSYVVTSLRESVMGCDRLLEEWTRIGCRLHHSKGILRSDRERGVTLLGKRLCDTFHDDQLQEWNLAYMASLTLPDEKQSDVNLAHGIFDADRPATVTTREFHLRLEQWVQCMPSRAKAVATLGQIIAATIAELKLHRETRRLVEEEELEIAVGRATSDETVEGSRRLKYESAHFHQVTKLLNAARVMRQSRLAGAFQEVMKIGMSAELIALTEENEAKARDAEGDSGVVAEPDGDFQSKADSESGEEAESEIEPEVAADAGGNANRIGEGSSGESEACGDAEGNSGAVPSGGEPGAAEADSEVVAEPNGDFQSKADSGSGEETQSEIEPGVAADAGGNSNRIGEGASGEAEACDDAPSHLPFGSIAPVEAKATVASAGEANRGAQQSADRPGPAGVKWPGPAEGRERSIPAPGPFPARADPRGPQPWPRGIDDPFRPSKPTSAVRPPTPSPSPPPTGNNFNPRDG